MPQEEDAFDLNFMPQEEDAFDLNLIPQGQEEDAMDLNGEGQEEVDDGEGQEEDGQVPKRKELSNKERYAAYFVLLVIELRNVVVQPEDKLLVATLLNVHLRTVERIWAEAKRQIALGQEVDVSNKKKGRAGRKRKELDLSRTSTIPLNKRRTIRALARSLGIPRSTLHWRFKLGELRRHTSTVKPLLKPENMIKRLEYCISMLDPIWISLPNPIFKMMDDMIHIDEKWFYMTKKRVPTISAPKKLNLSAKCTTRTISTKLCFLALWPSRDMVMMELSRLMGRSVFGHLCK